MQSHKGPLALFQWFQMLLIAFSPTLLPNSTYCESQGGQIAKFTALLATGNYHGVVGFAKAKGPTAKIAIQRVWMIFLPKQTAAFIYGILHDASSVCLVVISPMIALSLLSLPSARVKLWESLASIYPFDCAARHLDAVPQFCGVRFIHICMLACMQWWL